MYRTFYDEDIERESLQIAVLCYYFEKLTKSTKMHVLCIFVSMVKAISLPFTGLGLRIAAEMFFFCIWWIELVMD